MARCHNCGEEIGFFVFWKRSFRYLGSNIFRSRQMPVSDCPNCGIPCQESPVTAFGFLFLMVAFLFGVIKIPEWLNIKLQNDLVMFTIIFSVLFFGAILWWKNVSKLKQPSKFW